MENEKKNNPLCSQPPVMYKSMQREQTELQKSNKKCAPKTNFFLNPFFLLCVLKVRPIGYDGNNPTSVAEWLESLELGDYTKSFLVNGYTSMELVKKIWEIELINVSLQC